MLHNYSCNRFQSIISAAYARHTIGCYLDRLFKLFFVPMIYLIFGLLERVIDKENPWYNRKIKEAIYRKLLKPLIRNLSQMTHYAYSTIRIKLSLLISQRRIFNIVYHFRTNDQNSWNSCSLHLLFILFTNVYFYIYMYIYFIMATSIPVSWSMTNKDSILFYHMVPNEKS